MKSAWRALAGSVVVCAGLGGCASPPSHFYALSAVAVPAGAPLAVSVAVGPVLVPAVVDNARIVLTVAPNEVRPDDYNRWASPLQDEVPRAVVGDLTALLGSDRVTRSSNTAAPAADYHVSMEIERFDSVLGQDVTIEAEWVVKRIRDGALKTGRTVAREPADGGAFRGLAAAHSRAIARVSEDIAAGVRAIAASEK